MATQEATINAAKGLINFINKGASPYHVVDVCRRTLIDNGFVELSEKADWSAIQLQRSGKYFLTRNQSTIIAFAVGGKYEAGNGFSIVGAHTDSPCLKVKPRSTKKSNGWLSVGVECYGGGIWGTWFDRDLTIAGRAIIKMGGQLVHRLVHIEKPILRVPHLAIHLQRDMNEKFGPNKETHVQPVLATAAMAELNKDPDEAATTKPTKKFKNTAQKHHSVLIDAICKELDCSAEDLMDMELCLADTQPAAIGGAVNEFIFSPRLDNLFNVYTGLQGLLGSLKNDTLASDTNIRMLVCYDNEEVGSRSAQGAESQVTELVMRRIVKALDSDGSQYERSIANSYLISADQAHAVHPHYSEKHEENHKPEFHGGPVIKFNGNQKYATTAVTASILRAVAEKVNIPLQDVVVRNDSTCGSTIGPIISAKVGLRTVDIGGPMLSMHSIREMCCTSSVPQTISLYKAFYEEFPTIDAAFKLE